METPIISPPRSRSVKANGQAVSRLRQAKLWRVEDLARHAKCSVKTVENVERGGNVYMFTLAKFATALGVENSALIDGGDVPPDPPKKERRIEVNLTINIPFDDFDQSDQLIKLIESLKAIVGANDHIEVTRLMAGSTIITLEMSEADVHSLISAFMAGKLDEMQVQELNLRLTHETPKSDSYEDDLANLDLSGIEFTEHRLSTEPITDDVRIAEDPAKPKDAAGEEATAEEDANVPERKS